MSVEKDIQQLVDRYHGELAGVRNEHELRRVRAQYVGPEGFLTVGRKQWFAGAPTPEGKKAVGEAFNRAKAAIEAAFAERLGALEREAHARDLERTIDVT